MSRKSKQFSSLTKLQVFIAVGGGILLTIALSPDAKLLQNDISNNIFEKQISSDSLSELVPYKANVQYCNTNNRQQALDIYMPPSASPTPLVIFVHGGGWTYGDKKSKVMSYYGDPLVRQGIAVASLNYRLHPDHNYPDAYNDLSCALDFLLSHAKEFNISSESWGIMGDSAGAELAAYILQARPEMPIRSFVGLYGPYDLGLQLTRTPKKDVDAANFTGSHDPAFASSISPVAQSIKTSASYLLIHGENDTIVPPEQSKNFYDKIKQSGAEGKLIIIKKTGHYVSPTSSPSRTQVRTIIADFFRARS